MKRMMSLVSEVLMMKNTINSIKSNAKNTAAAFFVLLALSAAMCARADDVCKGNGYSMAVGNDFQVRRKDVEICSYRSGDDAVILLKDWPGLSKDDIEAFVDRGYQSTDIALHKRGELQQISTAGGSGYLAAVAGIVDDRAVEGIAGGFVGDSGQGVAVLISSVSDKWSEFEKRADAVIESIEFTEFKPRIGAHEWRQMLSGAGLSQREISEYGETRENYYFCGDGRFNYSSSHSEHAGGDGGEMFGFSSSRASGEWELRTVQGRTQLVLYYSSGRERRAIIEDREGETWIDDTRYYMIENSRCR